MADIIKGGYNDRECEGNSAKYHTGKKCIDCDNPAGTAWSKLWCVECNIKRMDKITEQLDGMMKQMKGER
jgi:hypothetical protein